MSVPVNAKGEARPTVICVLGAPRSGTSLTTRILNLIGVDLGPEDGLVEPVPGGSLWESRRIVELNERIINRFDGDGLAPPLPAAGWERSDELAGERGEARQILDETFAGSALWGWKDPRTCLTLPFWQRLIPDLRYVICLRNPFDSIASTVEHVEVSREQVLRTWLIYVASALVNTSNAPRTFVAYEEYFVDGGAQIEHLARFAGRGQPAVDTVEGERLSWLVSEDHWHFRGCSADDLGASPLTAAAMQLYLHLEILRAEVAERGSRGATYDLATGLSRPADIYARWVLDALLRG